MLICIVASAVIAMATMAITRMSVSSAMVHQVRIGSDGRTGLWVVEQRQRLADPALHPLVRCDAGGRR